MNAVFEGSQNLNQTNNFLNQRLARSILGHRFTRRICAAFQMVIRPKHI